MSRRLVLDAGALIGLARGDIRARAAMAEALVRDYAAIVWQQLGDLTLVMIVDEFVTEVSPQRTFDVAPMTSERWVRGQA